MKRITIFLCCVLLLMNLCSCSGKDEEFKEPVNFYYCNKEISYNSPTGVIQPEVREGVGYYGNLSAFLRAYLRGPISYELRSFIPSDVYLVSCEVSENMATVVLSAQFAKLSGVDLSAACSALLLTIHDYTGSDTLQVSAKDTQLDAKDVFVISMDEIVLMDTSV